MVTVDLFEGGGENVDLITTVARCDLSIRLGATFCFLNLYRCWPAPTQGILSLAHLEHDDLFSSH